MIAKVIDFPNPEERDQLIWQCGCGCYSFWLREDGAGECFNCGALAEDGAGGWRVPAPPAPGEPTPSTTEGGSSIVSFAFKGAALRRVLSRASEGDTAAIIVVQNDGAVHTWGEIGPEQGEWFAGRINIALEVILAKPDNGK